MTNNLDSDSPTGPTIDKTADTPPAANVIQRRDFLRLVGGVIGGFVLVKSAPSADTTPLLPPQFYCTIPGLAIPAGADALPQTISEIAQQLQKFVDPLPLPRVIQPSGTFQGMPLYEVGMHQFTQKLHRDLPPTTLWGYGGTYPGPTFEVEQDQPIAVRWKNKLPSQHLFPLDNTLHGNEGSTPAVRTVVHVHGLKVMPKNDGYPEAWFTRDYAQTGPDFYRQIYKYPNDQAATGLWYHDHTIGLTRLNLYAGLAGFYFVRSEAERVLNLPSGAYEVPLLIQDRTFNADGSLFYPVANNSGDPDPRVPPVWIPEFFGDTILVNGKVWPYLEVEPRKYRFRFLNGSNARFYRLSLRVSKGEVPAPKLNLIGTDGGFLSKPLERDHIVMSPAERFDVVIDFSGYEGKSIVLHNDAKAPFPNGNGYIPDKVMQFRVNTQSSTPDKSALPKKLYPVPVLDPTTAVKERDITLSAVFSAKFHAIIWMLNGHWDDPVTEDPHLGDTEIWRIINKGAVAHPIHLHLVQFQVLDRQPVNVSGAGDELVFTGPAVKAPDEESKAWKDTVIATAREVTRVIAKFELPKGEIPTPGTRYRYVYHCHMIEHEDNEMMRPYDVVA